MRKTKYIRRVVFFLGEVSSSGATVAPYKRHVPPPAQTTVCSVRREVSIEKSMTDTPAQPVPSKAMSPKKSKGPKKPKTTPTHPPVASMVNAAIKNLKERGGSSGRAIKKYIAANNKCDVEKLAPFIKRYLKSAVAKGILVQTKGKGASGSFKLKEKAATAKPKKAAAPKKVKKSTTGDKTPKKKKTTAKKATGEKKTKSPKKKTTTKKSPMKKAAKPKTTKPKAAKKGPKKPTAKKSAKK